MFRDMFEKAADADLSHVSDTELLDTYSYTFFPNLFLFPGISLPMVYRFRPIGGDPERTLFEILFMRPKPANGKAPDPPEPWYVSESESYASAPGVDPIIGAVYDQDTDNLAMQYRGFQGSAKPGQTPNMTRVWGKHAALIYQPANVNSTEAQVTFGFTAQWGEKIAGTIQEDPMIGMRGGTRVRVGESVAEVIAANDAAYFFQNAVA